MLPLAYDATTAYRLKGSALSVESGYRNEVLGVITAALNSAIGLPARGG